MESEFGDEIRTDRLGQKLETRKPVKRIVSRHFRLLRGFCLCWKQRSSMAAWKVHVLGIKKNHKERRKQSEHNT